MKQGLPEHRRAVRGPNERLRAARVMRCSPSGSGRTMSRQDLADLVNAHLAATGVARGVVDAVYVGKLERGAIRWPQAAYRAALRAVLDAASDAELGFYVCRSPRTVTVATSAASGPWASAAAVIARIDEAIDAHDATRTATPHARRS
jgi:hypothetical protein